MARAILITGTPGTGKTTLAKFLSEKFNLKIIDSKEYAKTHDLIVGKDEDRKSLIIDEEKWAKSIEKYLEEKVKDTLIIVEGLISHFIAESKTFLCIVTNCDLKILKQRLTNRSYHEKKVKENLESEIFNVCKVEAEELHDNIYSLNPSNSAELDLLVDKITKMM